METATSFDPIDWQLAERVARRMAGREHLAESYLAESLRDDFHVITAEAEALVAESTGLRAPGGARAVVVDRGEWVSANVTSMQRMLAPLTARIGARMAASPIAPIGRTVAGTETGVLLGYLAQRVLGQYDLLVPDDDVSAADAVYYVGGNVLALEKRFAFRPRDFRLWIAIHEVTHRAQFTAVPWMKPYYLSLVDSALTSVDPDPKRIVQALARAADEIRSGRNPLDDGGIVGLIASDEQRGALSRVQSLMSLLEGHGNSVMNKLGREHVAGQARMARVLQARRQSAGFTAFVHKFIGLESKMRQYEVGETFIAAVEREAGPHAIDAAWRGPEWLPTLDELRTPREWLERVDGRLPEARTAVAADLLATLCERADFAGLSAPVVVGCSGGADSIALLVLCASAGLEPVAVHVDHGLRSTSAADADAVGTAAARVHAPWCTVRVTVATGPNLEERARDARYAALETARADHGAEWVAVAHTADDQAETVLLNLLRGAGSAGLAGMATRRDRIARPLLGLRRAETRDLCADLQLAVVDDPMNDDLAFNRVAVRRKVLPLLESIAGRDLVPVLARQAGILRRESEYLDELAGAAWPGDSEPSASALSSLHPVLAQRAVRVWLGAPPPSYAEVARVLQVASGECRATQLAGGRRVRRSAGRMLLERE